MCSLGFRFQTDGSVELDVGLLLLISNFDALCIQIFPAHPQLWLPELQDLSAPIRSGVSLFWPLSSKRRFSLQNGVSLFFSPFWIKSKKLKLAQLAIPPYQSHLDPLCFTHSDIWSKHKLKLQCLCDHSHYTWLICRNKQVYICLVICPVTLTWYFLYTMCKMLPNMQFIHRHTPNINTSRKTFFKSMHWSDHPTNLPPEYQTLLSSVDLKGCCVILFFFASAASIPVTMHFSV